MTYAVCYQTPIMSMVEFNIGLLKKDQFPGLLIRSDEDGVNNIGIQINDTEVVKVDSAVENDAMRRAEYWKDHISEIQERYKDRKPGLKLFGGE